VRAILPIGLWVVLGMSGVEAVAAQTDADAVRVMSRDKVDSLLHAYGPTLNMRFYRRANDPFAIDGFFGKGLRYASRFEIEINVTPEHTIGLRVYPLWYNQRINIDGVRDPNGLERQLLRFSAHNFLFWGVDDALNVFAGFTFTLESGFPEEAIKIVLRSIPLVDQSVGEMARLIE
jgi:hypothetical protein